MQDIYELIQKNPQGCDIHIFEYCILITIETQPASTGVVALEPYDSRS